MAEGFEFVAMARALLREPDLPNRWAAGGDDASTCDHCNRCMPSIYSGTRCVTDHPEPIVVARKPLGERNVAANVLRHGTGALNIDGCRIELADGETGADVYNGPTGPGFSMDGERIGLSLDHAQVFIDFVDAEPKPQIDDLKQTLADLTIASDDRTTWFDLRTALGR